MSDRTVSFKLLKKIIKKKKIICTKNLCNLDIKNSAAALAKYLSTFSDRNSCLYIKRKRHKNSDIQFVNKVCKHIINQCDTFLFFLLFFLLFTGNKTRNMFVLVIKGDGNLFAFEIGFFDKELPFSLFFLSRNRLRLNTDFYKTS